MKNPNNPIGNRTRDLSACSLNPLRTVTNNERMPKQMATVRMGWKCKRERPRKRWSDEAEEGVKVNGKKKLTYCGQKPEEMEEELLEAKVHNGL